MKSDEMEMYLAQLLYEAALKEREECVKIVESHYDRLPHYSRHSDQDLVDKIEQGYGNAILNIAMAIRNRK